MKYLQYKCWRPRHPAATAKTVCFRHKRRVGGSSTQPGSKPTILSPSQNKTVQIRSVGKKRLCIKGTTGFAVAFHWPEASNGSASVSWPLKISGKSLESHPAELHWHRCGPWATAATGGSISGYTEHRGFSTPFGTAKNTLRPCLPSRSALRSGHIRERTRPVSWRDNDFELGRRMRCSQIVFYVQTGVLNAFLRPQRRISYRVEDCLASHSKMLSVSEIFSRVRCRYGMHWNAWTKLPATHLIHANL